MGEMIPLAAAVLLHEAGHLAAARLMKIPLRRGRGGFFGVRLQFDFSRCGYGREAAVHLAGPLCGIAAAFSVFAAETLRTGTGSERAGRFVLVNLALALMNLLPLPGFDGGGALLCFLRMLPEGKDGRGPERAERTAALAGWAARVLLWLFAARHALTEKPDVGLLLFAAGEIAGERRRG